MSSIARKSYILYPTCSLPLSLISCVAVVPVYPLQDQTLSVLSYIPPHSWHHNAFFNRPLTSS